MYNFYCDPELDIEKKLLFIKHLLPRYLNGIPDTEYLALFKCQKYLPVNPTIIETGCGASSIVLAYLAYDLNGAYLNWDPNELKQQEIKNVILNMEHGLDILQICKFIPSEANNLYLGISQFNTNISMAFLDSKHTSYNLSDELDMIIPKLSEQAVIVIDDADLTYIHTNTGLINIQRLKQGLKPIEIMFNEKVSFAQLLINKVNLISTKHWSILSDIVQYYNDNIDTDETNKYYAIDKSQMIDAKLESVNKNKNRFFPILLEKS